MNYCAVRARIRNFEEAVGNGTVPDAQNGFIIKQTVNRTTVTVQRCKAHGVSHVTIDINKYNNRYFII